MDIFATAAALSGAKLPADRELDCYDLTPVLAGGKCGREAYFFYRGFDLMAVRLGPWKAHFATQTGYGQPQPERHDPPELYHLGIDPSERFNVAAQHADVIQKIKTIADAHRAKMQPAASQMEL